MKMTFYEWINVEYGIVKRQYKELSTTDKENMRKAYKQYLNE